MNGMEAMELGKRIGGAIILSDYAKPGSCRICGLEGHLDYCQFWDEDDGWKLGKLCSHCFSMARKRAPRDDDYAISAGRYAIA